MDSIQLEETELFRGISGEERAVLLERLRAEQKQYEKGAVIYHAGEQVRRFGIVLSGSVWIENNDIWGNKSILDRIGKGRVFAEAYACLPGEPMMVSVVSAEASEVLLLDAASLPDAGADACPCLDKLARNLLSISAQKNLNLSRRMFHTSSKSIRRRLLSYLSFQAVRQDRETFTIPFNRQQLADYLGVDRSAMSNELSKMRRDGLIDYKKNVFSLKAGSGEGILLT